MSDIEEKIKDLPDKPGVYYFKDSNGEVLYIGKATSLRDRVRSYFNSDVQRSRSPLIQKMVQKAVDIDFETTGSVLEALIKERNEIKSVQPPYNTKEKDDKSHNFVVITNETFPQIRIERERELQTMIDPDEIQDTFGPYTSKSQLEEALKIIRKIFPFRGKKCTPAKEKGNDKPCFSYQIGLCPGVCTGEITADEYADTIENVTLFLEGNTADLKDKLQQDMQQAAETENFERAQEIKEKLFSLDHINDVALIEEEETRSSAQQKRLEGYDIAHTAGKSMVGAMVVLEGGEAKKSGYRKFNIKTVDEQSNDPKALAEVVRRRLKHDEWQYPDVFVIDGGKAQRNAVLAELEDAGVQIPVIGVVKDDSHSPKELIGPGAVISDHRKDIQITNSEAHRFVQSFHKNKRRKNLTD
jgi:excinuclease ABC subunit C